MALVLGHYRTARVIAALAIVPDLVWLLQAQFTGTMPVPFGPWAFWVLLNLAPVLAMAAFHRDAPPAARRPWLLALPAGYLLVAVPLLALQATGNSAWLPDFPGLCCLLVALACLAHAPRAWSRRAAGSGVWSLTLTLLAAVAGAYRIVSLADYLHDPHLIQVSLAELLILVAAVALVAPDAARAQAATPAPPPYPHADGCLGGPRTCRSSPRRARRPSWPACWPRASCSPWPSCSHLTPLGPDPAATMPQPHHLRSPFVLQDMRIQPPAPAGGCPAG